VHGDQTGRDGGTKKVREENETLDDLEHNEDGRGCCYQPLLKMSPEAADRGDSRPADLRLLPSQVESHWQVRSSESLESHGLVSVAPGASESLAHGDRAGSSVRAQASGTSGPLRQLGGRATEWPPVRLGDSEPRVVRLISGGPSDAVATAGAVQHAPRARRRGGAAVADRALLTALGP
jgi:hypothetical protein